MIQWYLQDTSTLYSIMDKKVRRSWSSTKQKLQN